MNTTRIEVSDRWIQTLLSVALLALAAGLVSVGIILYR
jgi:hypothetical protein